MPLKPKRLCPRCHRITSGPCLDCRRERNNNRPEDQKWYWTTEWKNFRAWYAPQVPLCWFCEAMGRATESRVLDHWPIERVSLPRDRWCDPTCIKPSCHTCHGKYGPKYGRKAKAPPGVNVDGLIAELKSTFGPVAH